jgi:hypothetical protein
MTPSRTAKSPFYGVSRDDGEGGGCVDPRPTAMLLLDALLHRVSDKSPAVRARALAAIGSLIHPTHAFAAANAALLGHLAAAVALSAAASNDGAPSEAVPAAGGDVSLPLTDITMAWLAGGDGVSPGETSANTSRMTPVPASSADTGARWTSTAGPHPLVPILVRRLQDVKSGVRKAALAAVEALAQSGTCEVITSRILFHAAAGAAVKANGSITGVALTPSTQALGDLNVEKCAQRVLSLALQVSRVSYVAHTKSLVFK